MDDFLYRRELPDGREICVTPMLFGNHRVTIGVSGSGMYEDGY